LLVGCAELRTCAGETSVLLDILLTVGCCRASSVSIQSVVKSLVSRPLPAIMLSSTEDTSGCEWFAAADAGTLFSVELRVPL
ncbi:hypothetical protein DFJ73DRAFT_880106, partial [Zopfochytrium polystomum]